jgi:hypothetical protein
VCVQTERKETKIKKKIREIRNWKQKFEMMIKENEKKEKQKEEEGKRRNDKRKKLGRDIAEEKTGKK